MFCFGEIDFEERKQEVGQMNVCHQKIPGFTQRNQSSYYFRQLGETVRIKAGTMIVNSQEIPEVCYYIRSGQVLAGTLSQEGNETILFSFEKESIMLSQYVLSGTKSPLFYRAKTEVIAQKISYLELIRGIKSSFHITMDIINSITEFSDLSLYRMLSSQDEKASVKICNQLINLTHLYGEEEDGGYTLAVRISQAMLGNMTGSHRVTVNREMKKLKELKILDIKEGYYYIPNLNRLIEYRDSQINF